MLGKSKQQQHDHHCLTGLVRAKESFMGSQKWEHGTEPTIQSFLVRGRGFMWPCTGPGLGCWGGPAMAPLC